MLARDEQDRLTEDELVELSIVLLAAGYEPTASQIVNFTYTLLGHPEQLALLRARPELVPGAVEELMRWVPLLVTADTLPWYALVDVVLPSGPERSHPWSARRLPVSCHVLGGCWLRRRGSGGIAGASGV